jgi:hypothetical protein
MTFLLGLIAVMTAGGVWLAESRDRPRRRAERLAAAADA